MNRGDLNTDFLGYSGTIDRKNYAINMLILICLFAVISFVNLDNLLNSSPVKFLSYVVDFVVYTFKFVIFFSVMSLIYRRMADIVKNKSQKTKDYTKTFYNILYIFPILYLFCTLYLFDTRPGFLSIADAVILFALLPAGLLTAFLVTFIK